MKVIEFREKIKTNSKLFVDGQEFVVKEVVKFRFDDGSFYIKCFLNDGFVFADDLNENIFLLVKEMKTSFKMPFPAEVKFAEKNFKFFYSAHARAEEVEGQEIFKKGEAERFWDYQADDGTYLSLGIDDRTGERSDFYGRILKNESVKIE